jgi:hypothetical protein
LPRAEITGRTAIAVIARDALGHRHHAAGPLKADLERAALDPRTAAGAIGGDAALTALQGAAVERTRIRVAAGLVLGDGHAAHRRIAGVARAGHAVVAAQRHAQAAALEAGIIAGAGVTVVTGVVELLVGALARFEVEGVAGADDVVVAALGQEALARHRDAQGRRALDVAADQDPAVPGGDRAGREVHGEVDRRAGGDERRELRAELGIADGLEVDRDGLRACDQGHEGGLGAPEIDGSEGDVLGLGAQLALDHRDDVAFAAP